MELRHLRYFVMLADELSFTRAAKRLHISQPPLSTQIGQLEAEIGAKLLDRSSRRVRLTSAGEAFLADARAILDHVDKADRRARAIGNGLAGRVEIGLSGSHFQGPLPGIIGRYIREHPHVATVLNQIRPADQLVELRNRRIDISISRTAVNDSVLTSTKLWSDPVRVALQRGHPLSHHTRLTLYDLREQPFITLRLDSSAYARYLYDSCVQAGFAPSIAQSLTEIPAIVSMVAAGLGVAFVPQSLMHLHEREVCFVPLHPDPLKSDVYMIFRLDTSSSVVHEFAQFVIALASGPDSH